MGRSGLAWAELCVSRCVQGVRGVVAPACPSPVLTLRPSCFMPRGAGNQGAECPGAAHSPPTAARSSAACQEPGQLSHKSSSSQRVAGPGQHRALCPVQCLQGDAGPGSQGLDEFARGSSRHSLWCPAMWDVVVAVGRLPSPCPRPVLVCTGEKPTLCAHSRPNDPSFLTA